MEKLVFGHDYCDDWQKEVLDIKWYLLSPNLHTSACLAQPSRDCVYRQWIIFAIKEPEVCRICKIQNYLSVLYLT